MHKQTLFNIFAHHVWVTYGVELLAFNANCILAKDESSVAHFIYYADKFCLMICCPHHIDAVPSPWKASFEQLVQTTGVELLPVDNTKQRIK